MIKANKLVTICLLILVSFFLTACTHTKKTSQPQTTDSRTETPQQDSEESIQGSFLDFMKIGRDLRCTYSGEEQGTAFSGEVFVSKNKIRGNSTITSTEGSIQGYVISDGTYMHVWSNQANIGTKIKIDEFSKDIEGNADAKSKDFEQYRKQYNYSCKPWDVDNSVFDVPTDVEFMDFTSLLNQVTPGGNANEVACNACNYIQDATDKQECLHRLSCE